MINQNRILTGSSGYVWINGKMIAQIKSIEAKIAGAFEDVECIGEYATHSAYTGWTGEGSLTMQKIDSTVIDMLGEAFKTGEMPEIKITTKLEDKSTKKAERVAISNVVFTEFNLVKLEAKALIEEEVPFKFSEYDIIEKI